MKRLLFLFISLLLVGCMQPRRVVTVNQNYTTSSINKKIPVIFKPTAYKFQVTQKFENQAGKKMYSEMKDMLNQLPKKRTINGEVKITSLGKELLWEVRINKILEDNMKFVHSKPLIKYHILTKKNGQITNKEIFFPANPSSQETLKKSFIMLVDQALKADVLFHLNGTDLKTGDKAKFWAASQKKPPVNIHLASLISAVKGELIGVWDDLAYRIDGYMTIDGQPVIKLSLNKMLKNQDGFYLAKGILLLNKDTLQPIKSTVIFECEGGRGDEKIYAKETTIFTIL